MPKMPSTEEKGRRHGHFFKSTEFLTERHKQCDQKKPQCDLCHKLGQHCDYSQEFQFRSVCPTSELAISHSSIPPAPLYEVQVSKHESSQFNKMPSDAGDAPDDAPVSLQGIAVEQSEASSRTTPDSDSYCVNLLPVASMPPSWYDLNRWKTNNQSSSANAETGVNDSSSSLAILDTIPRFVDSLDSYAASYQEWAPATFPAARPTIPRSLPNSDCSVGQQLLYLKAWQDYCVPGLPPILKIVENLGSSPPVISESIMALSAFRLSRLKAQQDLGRAQEYGLWRRDDHWIASQHFYCAALRVVASWIPISERLDNGTMMQAMLLFCCLELATGNFDVFRVHSDGVKALIQNGIESMIAVDRTRGIRILQAWAQTNMHSWWLRSHLGTPWNLMTDVSFRIDPLLQIYLNARSTRRTSVMANLCETYRLSTSLIVHQVDSTDDLRLGILPQENSASLGTGSPGNPEEDKDQLILQSVLLTEWHDCRASSDLPISAFDQDTNLVHFPSSDLQVVPLQFSSHAAAMNYAYYATSRIMQASSGSLSFIASETSLNGDETCGETNYWSKILLGIAAGLDWGRCLRLNDFSIGLSSLLLTCALFCSNPEVGSWIQAWIALHSRGASEEEEEGSFPVVHISRCLCLINEERGKGVDVIAIFQSGDGSEGHRPPYSHRGQLLMPLQFLCRSRRSGKYEIRYRTE
jgi:hypothetical protein